jgi:hypothetical protein
MCTVLMSNIEGAQARLKDASELIATNPYQHSYQFLLQQRWQVG